MKQDLTIRPLTVEDARDLSSLLQSQSAEYTRFFTPFSFDRGTLRKILSEQNEDAYMGLFWGSQPVGFFMLRGLDAGYEAPAFGILIDREIRGFGLEMLSLETAKILCKLRGAPGMITKVHPDNMSAKGVLRKIGFTLRGVESQSGRLIYYCEVKQTASRVESPEEAVANANGGISHLPNIVK